MQQPFRELAQGIEAAITQTQKDLEQLAAARKGKKDELKRLQKSLASLNGKLMKAGTN